MRYALRRDSNDKPLANFARALGWWLHKTHTPGDYLGAFRGVWHVVEIKDPAKEGHADEFTDAQREFHAEAFRRGLSIKVWRTREDVVRDSGGRVAA